MIYSHHLGENSICSFFKLIFLKFQSLELIYYLSFIYLNQAYFLAQPEVFLCLKKDLYSFFINFIHPQIINLFFFYRLFNQCLFSLHY
jgi:hypothetical protein